MFQNQEEMDKFIFRSNDIFVLYRRGIVFRGFVQSGIGKVGDIVSFNTKKGLLKATISFIELNRKSIEETERGSEIGLLLVNFNQSEADEMININANETENLPSPLKLLNIELPLYIESCEENET